MATALSETHRSMAGARHGVLPDPGHRAWPRRGFRHRSGEGPGCGSLWGRAEAAAAALELTQAEALGRGGTDGGMHSLSRSIHTSCRSTNSCTGMESLMLSSWEGQIITTCHWRIGRPWRCSWSNRAVSAFSRHRKPRSAALWASRSDPRLRGRMPHGTDHATFR